MHISISKVNFTSIGINIAKVDFGRYDSGGEPQLNGLYITPADASAISVTPNSKYYTLHGKYLKYSLNGKKWKNWNGSVTIEPEQKMYLKGEDDYVWNSSTNGKLITSDGNYNVGGDISSLTNFITEVKEYTFKKLFDSDSSIKDAASLILPATTLASNCYYGMFRYCNALTTAPELPATMLANDCYSLMFYGCKSLTAAPALPATTLVDWCYSEMFNGCTSLTTAPALPATTLAQYCYNNMFNGCKSLTAAPALPATMLTTSCYSNMFSNCSSLTTAPALPATTLTYYCYYEMFSNCSSLTTAPELPATTLAPNCYSYMLYGCSKLKSITMLATDISAYNCLYNWVLGVATTGTFIKAPEMTSLHTGASGIPEGWTVVDYTDYMTLSALGDGEITITIPAAINSTYATSLSYSKDKSTWNETIIDDTAQTISIPVTSGENVYLKGIAKQLGNSSTGVNINSTANINASGNTMSLLYGDDYKDKVALPSGSEYTFSRLFRDNTHLINTDELILPATTLKYACYHRMFYGCTALIAAPALPANTLANQCYQYMFYMCKSLTTAPVLPAATLTQQCYQYMFFGCTSLTAAPELPATNLADYCYECMFQGCTSLTAAHELPATTLTYYCYKEMFWGCTSLTTAPELPATTLAMNCYSSMFYNCKSLANAPALPVTKLADNCYREMFCGCASLTTAPELPATKLADYCYYSMLMNCTSLTTAPALPAATLANYCYTNMFNGCTSLTTAPELPATTLAEGCYYSMFRGCTSLTTAPELNATTLANRCYYQMFLGCTALTTAPELNATTLANRCYREMFDDCTSLTTAPELPATTLAEGCYQYMFLRCTALNNITMLATDISASDCLYNWVSGVASTGTFTKSPEMTTLPTGNSGIPTGWTVKDYGVVDYSQEYMTLSALGDGEITITIPAAIDSSYVTSLSYSKDKSNWTDTIIDDTEQTITIPVTSGENVYLKGIADHLGNSSTGVNINSTANINASGNTMSLLYGDDYKDKVAFPSGSPNTFYILFRNNTHLINAYNLILPAATLNQQCYHDMFNGCTSLTTAPTLPATTLAQYCYFYMFNGCTSLTTAPELPETTLANGCYANMFKGCTALTTAPELPATALKPECYLKMFMNCTSLNNITMLATKISASLCLSNWVEGVSSTGTFTKAAEMTSLSTGYSGIPSGWTVVDYTAA